MIVERRSPLPACAEDVFQWHARPGAFERLIPPWESVHLSEPHPGIVEGSQFLLEVKTPWGMAPWLARHTEVRPGRGFTDVQVRGPFAAWRHRHDFEPIDGGHSTLSDRIEVELPWGPLGELAEPWVRRRLRRTLRYRQNVTAGDLALHHALARAPRLTVAISGASGFIGRTVAAVLSTGGHRVIPLVRRPARLGEIQWDLGRLDPRALAPVDAVIHLAGETIAGRRWTPERQRQILESRVRGTTTIVDAMLAASPRQRTLISASAIGFYGDRGDDSLTEDSGVGTGFLAEVAQDWEAAARRAESGGVRTVESRFGIVLSGGGGALAQMLPIFRLGIGGPLGPGRQWMSWISKDDAVGALVHALFTESLAGPVNAVAPEPVSNVRFTETLGRVLGRPAALPAPAFALRLAVGGLADEGLLASTRVVPAKLTASGYRFRHPTLESALRHELGRELAP